MGSDIYETIEDLSYDEERGVPKLGVGDNCYIHNAIIDKNARIGNNVSINGGSHLENSDHELYTIKDGIVVIKKDRIIPDGFVIG